MRRKINPPRHQWQGFFQHTLNSNKGLSRYSNRGGADLGLFNFNSVQRLAPGDLKELITAIKEYLAQNNKQPKPFVWTATAQQIIEKVGRCKEFLRHYTSLDPI